MGVFRVRVQVFSLKNPEQRHDVDVVVDTGATRTVVPRAIAEGLGVRPERRQTFRMVNGEKITREVAWIGVSLQGNSTHTEAILGEAGDAPVLGALTLEELSLEVDPTRGLLRPAEELLLLAA